MLIWTTQAIAAASLGLLALLPAIGAYNYALIGILVGLLAASLIAFKLEYEIELRAPPIAVNPQISTLVLSLLGGAVAGLLWPAAISTGVLWLIVADRDGGGPPATA